MSSNILFQIPTDPSQIPPLNSGIINPKSTSVVCQRSISAETFGAGTQDFNFNVGVPERIIPNKCYFRVRMTLEVSRNAGVSWRAPLVEDGYAFAEHPLDCSYNSCEVKLASQPISDQMNFMGQAAAYKCRTTTSDAWDETLGKSVFYNGTYEERLNATAYDGRTQKARSYLPFTPGGTTLTYDPVLGTLTIPLASLVQGRKVIPTIGDTIVQRTNDPGVPGDLDRVFTVVNRAFFNTGTGNLEVRVMRVDTSASAVNSTEPSFIQTAASLDDSKARNSIELAWQPPLGWFDKVDALPPGVYSISLVPKNDPLYQTAMVENQLGASFIASRGLSFRVRITNLEFNVTTVQGQAFANNKYIIPMMEYQMLAKNFPTPFSPQDLQETFTAPASTISLGYFAQEREAGTRIDFPPSRFMTAGDNERSIEYIQIQFKSQQQPPIMLYSSHTGETTVDGPNVTNLTQRLWETMQNLGLSRSIGGAEDFEKFLKKGFYVSYPFNATALDRSTGVMIRVKYTNQLDSAQMFLVSKYRQLVEVTMDRGFVTSVTTSVV